MKKIIFLIGNDSEEKNDYENFLRKKIKLINLNNELLNKKRPKDIIRNKIILDNFLKEIKETFKFKDELIITGEYLGTRKNRDFIFDLIKKENNGVVFLKEGIELLEANNDFEKVNEKEFFSNVKEFDLFLNLIKRKTKELLNSQFKPSSINLKKRFFRLIDEHFENEKNNKYEIDKLKEKSKIKDIEKIIEEDFSVYIKTKDIIKKYYKYNNLFKNYQNLPENDKYHFDIIKTKNKNENIDFIEFLNDNYRKIKEHSDVKRYAKSFLKSYKNLLNDKNLEYFRTIYKMEEKREEIEKEIRKIAAFKSEDDLSNVLLKIINNKKINAETIIENINNNKLSVDIVKNNDNKLILAIKDFETSKKLGSSQWCISYDYDNFYDYLETEFFSGQHYFVWDFKKEHSDPNRFFALTLSCNTEICAMHDINDDDIFLDRKNILSDDDIKKMETHYAENVFDKKYNQFHMRTNKINTTKIDDKVLFPLIIFNNKMIDYYDSYYNIDEDGSYSLGSYIIKNTIRDFKKFPRVISAEELVENVFSYGKFIEKLSDIHDLDFYSHYNNLDDIIEKEDLISIINEIKEIPRIEFVVKHQEILSDYVNNKIKFDNLLKKEKNNYKDSKEFMVFFEQNKFLFDENSKNEMNKLKREKNDRRRKNKPF